MFTSSARSLTWSFPSLAVAALLASGCSDPTDPSLSLEAGKDGGTLVSLKAERLIGYSYNITPVPSECVTPLNRRTGLDLAGTVSHLGWASVAMEHCNSTAGPAAGGGTITAANGDQVWLSYTVAASGITLLKPPPLPVIVRFEAPFVVAGGTGRFAAAIGSGTFVCVRTTPVSTADFPAHTPAYSNYYDCSLDGVISTVGGDKGEEPNPR